MREHFLRAAAATIALVAVLAYAPIASAHAVGASFNATTSPYVIDVGYDTIPFQAQQSVRFDFVLRDEKTGAAVPFDQVWVRVTNSSDTLLATGLFHQPFGPTTLLYVFSAPGSYKLEPSFRSADGTEIAVASFPISVGADPNAPSPLMRYAPHVGLFILGGIIGLAAAGLRTRRRS